MRHDGKYLGTAWMIIIIMYFGTTLRAKKITRVFMGSEQHQNGPWRRDLLSHRTMQGGASVLCINQTYIFYFNLYPYLIISKSITILLYVVFYFPKYHRAPPLIFFNRNLDSWHHANRRVLNRVTRPKRRRRLPPPLVSLPFPSASRQSSEEVGIHRFL